MTGADQVLGVAWPARRGDDYMCEMLWTVGELETIPSEMQAKGFDKIEQSRTHRLLGSVYVDLEPVLRK